MNSFSNPDVLLEIFARLVDFWPAPSWDHNSLRPRPLDYVSVDHGDLRLGWVNVTFVCVQWRRLAINTPIFWTDVNAGLAVSWIDRFVLRSGSALLTLGNRDRADPTPIHFASYPVDEPQNIIRIMPAVWRRIRYLHITAEELKLPSDVLECLSKPTHTMERCELLGSNEADDVALEGELFASEAPCLRHFFCDLRSITFPWRASFLYQLQSLVICCKTGLPPVADLVNTVFRRLQCVKWLDLAYLPSLDNDSASLEPVHLPHIEKLGLEGSAGSVAFVLKHLRILDVASIELRCNGHSSDEHSQALYLAIHSHYESRHFPAPVALYINQVREVHDTMPPGLRVVSRRLQISAWSTATSIESLHSPDAEMEPIKDFCTRPSSLLLTFDGTIVGDEMLLRNMVSDILPFSRASVLHAPVRTSPHGPCPHKGIFRIAPQIETLHIGRGDYDKISDCRRKLHVILQDLLDHTHKALAGRIPLADMLLPKLHILHVGYDAPGTWHPAGSDSTVSAMDKLRDLVLARAAVGAPLRAIRIVDSSLQVEEPRPHTGGNPPAFMPIVIPYEIRALME